MIIKTYKLPSGVTVNIHDDCMAASGSDEEKRIVEEQNRVAREILYSAAQRNAARRAGRTAEV